MPPAVITFHGDLATLVRTAGQDGRVQYPVDRRGSIKDVVEALGVPHTEVYGLLVNGAEAGFGHILAPGESVAVRPAVPPVDVSQPTRLRPEGYERGRFLVDVNVNKLATLLRLLGFDAAGTTADVPDAELAAQAAREGRVVLSRDTLLLRRKAVMHGRLIRAARPEDQVREVLRFYGLGPPYVTFRRCLRCNVPLVPVSKAEVMDRLLPKTKKYFDEFHQCPRCRRIYWAGSHHDRMLEWVAGIGGG